MVRASIGVCQVNLSMFARHLASELSPIFPHNSTTNTRVPCISIRAGSSTKTSKLHAIETGKQHEQQRHVEPRSLDPQQSMRSERPRCWAVRRETKNDLSDEFLVPLSIRYRFWAFLTAIMMNRLDVLVVREERRSRGAPYMQPKQGTTDVGWAPFPEEECILQTHVRLAFWQCIQDSNQHQILCDDA